MLPTAMLKTVEGTTAYDWASQRGLDWEAKKVPLFYQGDDGVMRESSKVAVVRSDTMEELGVVSAKYEIVQPIEILKSFELAVNRLGFEMDGIGLYDNGKLIWGRANSHRKISLNGDEQEAYFYMLTTYDGTTSTVGFIGWERLVCCNAFNRLSDKLFSIRHITGLADVSSAVLAFDAHVNDYQLSVERLMRYRMTGSELRRFFNQLLYPDTDFLDLSKRQQDVMYRYGRAVFNSPGVSGQGTAWDALNAVTYIVDHDPIRRTDGHEKSAFIGAGNRLKERAYQMLMELV